jgi:hypothetical protein
MCSKSNLTAQACAVLLGNEVGATMNAQDLLGLLYLADRQSWLESGMKVTEGEWAITPRGPIVALSQESFPTGCGVEWVGDQVVLKGLPGDGWLSDYTEEVLRSIRDRKSTAQAELQGLPENKLRGGSLDPIMLLVVTERPSNADQVLAKVSALPPELKPLAVINLDRRVLHGDGKEQWIYDGFEFERVLSDREGYDLISEVLDLSEGDLPSGDRFIVFAEVVSSVNYWGEYDEWVEDFAFVSLPKDDT